jgi:hypothetical protein
MVAWDPLDARQEERAATDLDGRELCIAAVDECTFLADAAVETMDLTSLRRGHCIVGVRGAVDAGELAARKPVTAQMQRTRQFQLGDRHRLAAFVAPVVEGVNVCVMGWPPGVVRARRDGWSLMKASVVVGSSARGSSVTTGVVMTTPGDQPVEGALGAKRASRAHVGFDAQPGGQQRRSDAGP